MSSRFSINLKDDALKPMFVYVRKFIIHNPAEASSLLKEGTILPTYYHEGLDEYYFKVATPTHVISDGQRPSGVAFKGAFCDDDVMTYDFIPLTASEFNNIPWTPELLKSVHNNLPFLSKADLPDKEDVEKELPKEVKDEIVSAIRAKTAKMKASEGYMDAEFPVVASTFDAVRDVLSYILYDSDQDLIPIFRNSLEGGSAASDAYMVGTIQSKLNEYVKEDNNIQKRQALYDIIGSAVVQLAKIS